MAGLYYVALKEMRLRVKMWDISGLAQMIFNTAYADAFLLQNILFVCAIFLNPFFPV